MKCILHVCDTKLTKWAKKQNKDPFCIDFHIDQGNATSDTTKENPFESNKFENFFAMEKYSSSN